MLKFERVHLSLENWDSTLQQFPERTIFQSAAWLSFVSETQSGEIVIAALREGNTVLGYFSGLMIRRFGLRILGSPFPGWTTGYMGLVLAPEVPRTDALEALQRFAFSDLRCVHLEVMDRNLGVSAVGNRYPFLEYNSFEIDLSRDEDELFKGFSYDCRHCARKGMRLGIQIQQAGDAGFADDYYNQLIDVFAKRRLIPPYGKDRVSALIRHLQPTGNLLLLRALDADRHCVATLISVGMHNRAEVWSGASWRAYQHLRPNEVLVWETIRYWKSRSVQFLDMGGDGAYKRRYGGCRISVPWIRTSRSSLLPMLRTGAALAMKARQRCLGGWHAIAMSSLWRINNSQLENRGALRLQKDNRR